MEQADDERPGRISPCQNPARTRRFGSSLIVFGIRTGDRENIAIEPPANCATELMLLALRSNWQRPRRP